MGVQSWGERKHDALRTCDDQDTIGGIKTGGGVNTAPALPRSCISRRVSGDKEEGAGDEAQHEKGEEREGDTMPALPRYWLSGWVSGEGEAGGGGQC